MPSNTGVAVIVSCIALLGGDRGGDRGMRSFVRATTPLHHGLADVTTLGMGTGGYRQIDHEAYRSVSWVLNSPNWFVQAGWVSPASPGNVIDTQARADAYAAFVTGWVLETLHLVQHVDGAPIGIDLEDLGVDVALGYADWALAVAEANGNPHAWVSGNPYQTGGYASDWATCEQYVISALRSVTAAVRAAYPQSPIGWYNGGPHIYSPWCEKLGQGPQSSNYKVAEKYFELTAAKDPRISTWKWVDPDHIGADFGFVTFYPNLTGLQQKPHETHFTYGTRESLQNWNHLVLKHGGRSTSGWAGIWDRMFIGQPQQWVVSDARVYSNAKHPLETLAESGVVGGYSCEATTSTNPLVHWKESRLQHVDYITPLAAKGDDPGPILNPTQPLEVLLDYLAWQWTDDCSRMPEGYQTVAHRPSAANVATESILADRWYDMKFGIWDAMFTGPHDFDANVVTSGPRDEIDIGLFERHPLPASLMKILARVFADPHLFSEAVALGGDLGGKPIAGLMDKKAISYAMHVVQRRGIFLGGAPGGKSEHCGPDLNGDGAVDASDLGVLLGDFGPCTFACIADFDASGRVDAGDLGVLLGNWGGCP